MSAALRRAGCAPEALSLAFTALSVVRSHRVRHVFNHRGTGDRGPAKSPAFDPRTGVVPRLSEPRNCQPGIPVPLTPKRGA